MITIAHSFYNQHQMLSKHLAAWSLHREMGIQYVIVDDGSPTPISLDYQMLNIETYRIMQNIPWNIAGARNLCCHVAKAEWVLVADIDHIITSDVLEKILDLDLTDPNVVYTFNRKREDGFIGCDAIVNFLVNKTRYFEIGGHDEDYSGHYGREETFFFHCLQYHRVRIVRCCDIFLPWYPKIGGTRGLVRNKSHNTLLFDRKMVELKAGRYKNGVMLRFNWKLTNNL